MLSRLASDAPPPEWQVWLVVGLGAACAAIWFAAKAFRIGLLMHGKPPTFGTLITLGAGGIIAHVPLQRRVAASGRFSGQAQPAHQRLAPSSRTRQTKKTA
jgi:type VI protein secretion system component VasK